MDGETKDLSYPIRYDNGIVQRLLYTSSENLCVLVNQDFIDYLRQGQIIYFRR